MKTISLLSFKSRLNITLLLFLFPPAILSARQKSFGGNAFLSGNGRCTVYADSSSGKIRCYISSDPAKDKYYIFELIAVCGDRVKVRTQYTIDAGHNDPHIIPGWIKCSDAAVYYNLVRSARPFLYVKDDPASAKTYVTTSEVHEPLIIEGVVFHSEKVWLQVAVGSHHGWLSPEMQCMDIWNACQGN